MFLSNNLLCLIKNKKILCFPKIKFSEVKETLVRLFYHNYRFIEGSKGPIIVENFRGRLCPAVDVSQLRWWQIHCANIWPLLILLILSDFVVSLVSCSCGVPHYKGLSTNQNFVLLFNHIALLIKKGRN
jgi:hypothetical protein